MGRHSVLCGILAMVVGAAAEPLPQHRLPVPDRYEFPAKVKVLDVYGIGRFDFNQDGMPEQIVIDSGFGTGGPIWHIRSLNGIALSGELFGSVTLLEPKNGYYQLLVESKVGHSERTYSLYVMQDEKYVRTRQEVHHYDSNTVEVTR